MCVRSAWIPCSNARFSHARCLRSPPPDMCQPPPSPHVPSAAACPVCAADGWADANDQWLRAACAARGIEAPMRLPAPSTVHQGVADNTIRTFTSNDAPEPPPPLHARALRCRRVAAVRGDGGRQFRRTPAPEHAVVAHRRPHPRPLTFLAWRRASRAGRPGPLPSDGACGMHRATMADSARRGPKLQRPAGGCRVRQAGRRRTRTHARARDRWWAHWGNRQTHRVPWRAGGVAVRRRSTNVRSCSMRS